MPNVVPGKTVFTLDARHMDALALQRFTDEATKKMQGIVNELGMEISINMWLDAAPVPMDSRIVDILRQSMSKK